MADKILMIHGMYGGSWCWAHYRGFFEGLGYECVTPTLRHHDVSPQDPPPPKLGETSLLDYAADLEAEIGQLDQLPIIFGHSMGGLLAQVLAARGLARAIVLLTPAAPAGIMALRPSVIRSFWSTLTRPGFWRLPHRPTFEEACYSTLNMLQPDEQRATYDLFVHESGKAAAEIGFWIFDQERASSVDENEVKCPVLVVAGAEDRITPPTVVRKVARKYGPTTQYAEAEGHGHWLMAEPGWQQVAETVADWLDRIRTGFGADETVN
jgi:pimeloyl-ACP methyl ester carboxylesterase